MRRRVVLALVVVALLLSWVVNPFRATARGWFFGTLDGAGGANGATTNNVGSYNAGLVYGGAPHNWYYDVTSGDLRHGWWTGTVWATETLDGAGGANGATTNDVGSYISVVLYNGQPHVWYWDVSNHDLRHGWWNGSGWAFETLDGAGGANGATTNDVGSWSSAILYNGEPHVWYYDITDADLRHGWWNGSGWAFETLDGNVNLGANGQITNNVGRYTAAILYGEQPHVWYYDVTADDLRHGWWNGEAWAFETLDGAGGGSGRTTNAVGASSSATLYNGEPHVWYFDSTGGDLRHAWWNGSGWTFETLDGNGTTNGQTNNVVGRYNTVALYNGEPHVWYFDDTGGDLRHAWWNGLGWVFETLDGNGTSNSRTDNVAGLWNSVVVVDADIHVFNYEPIAGDARQACFC